MMTENIGDEHHPIIIETWCKTNGCRADVYRQEIRRLKDEKLALEARLSKMEKALYRALIEKVEDPIDIATWCSHEEGKAGVDEIVLAGESDD
jgi:hypothetical protein